MGNIAESVISKFSEKSIMEGVDKKQLKEFTQKYYGLIVLTARKIEEDYKNIRIDSYPYMNDSEYKKKVSEKYKEFSTTEDILIYFRASNKQELYITENGIYFTMYDLVEEDYKHGFVPFDKISSLEIIQKGDYFCLYCNEVLLITDDVKNKDFYEDIDLIEYIKHISDNNLSVSDDEMAGATERHMDVIEMNKIKQLSKQDKIVNILYNYGCNNCFIISNGLAALYDIKKSKLSYDFRKFSEYKNITVSVMTSYILTPYCDVNFYKVYSFNERQFSVIQQYLDEIETENEKEKNLEEDLENQIKKLQKLKTIGLITDEEFEEKRLALVESLGI